MNYFFAIDKLKIFCLITMTILAFASPSFEKLRDMAKNKYGARGESTINRWINLLNQAPAQKDKEKLLAVNDFFNQIIVFSNDNEIWKRSDYWATPLETMGRQLGDCEDFSIAKYVSLLKMGIPMNKLRLTYVKAKIGSLVQAHMVLAYYDSPNADPLILDNLSKEIRPASMRQDLTPIFSFNSAGLWVGNTLEPKVRKPETRLSRWRDVLTRMQTEGLH